MKTPFVKRIVMPMLIMGAGIFAVLSTSALDIPGFGTKNAVQVTMSVEEARVLITEQQNMNTIPRETWRKMLDSASYKILWEKGTERAFTGELLKEKRTGTYVTKGCKLPVFSSEHKFKSGSGWPSFWEALDKDNIVLKEDRSWGMRRTEVLSKCGEHLGHVFDDGPDPTGLRYCINSKALEFLPAEP